MSKKKPEKKKHGARRYAVGGIFAIIFGAVLALLPTLLSEMFAEQNLLTQICLYGGIAIVVIGCLCLLVSLLEHRSKKKATKQDEPVKKSSAKNKNTVKSKNAEPVRTVNATLQNDADPTVRYFPSEHDYQFVQMGRRQSIDEKFNEIAKMDRTQFVLYVARLFSRKGFQVKFTPVLDNYDIDLLVEHGNATVAVCCLLTSKVLGSSDVQLAVEGKKFYQVSECTVVTNMYFDRSALDLAKKEKVTLIDRNLLAEDFMK